MTTATTNRPLRFVLNGAQVELGAIDPTRSVLSYLREERRCTGTKEGCAEGDCGACTVVVGELLDDSLHLRAINACIQFVPVLDGKAIFTVEYLRSSAGELHPVQQAMVDCHGSQCGFCTPGFVMSLWSSYNEAQLTGKQPEREQLATALGGNLCRCTGYRTILDAAEQMFNYAPVQLDRAAVIDQLKQLDVDEPLNFSTDGRTFFAPHNLDQLLQLRAEHPSATLLAGSTDVGLWVNKQLQQLDNIISVNRVVQLKQIDESASELRIGAAVTLSDAYARVARHYSAIGEMWERFASVPVRNAGTLGGNIANGSPIGDSMPWLIALKASVILSSVRGSRRIALESLYLDYMKKDLQEDEIVEAIVLPLPTPELVFQTYKVSKRYDSDISAVCAAFAVRVVDGRIIESRVAFGGMAAIPKRATACEAALTGASFNESTVRVAMSALSDDFSPLDDMRASATYRSRIAANLLYRFYLESRPDAPLASSKTRVFTRLMPSSS